MNSTSTVGDYLIRRLRELGAGHVFGVPGDYVLGFYDRIQRSELKLINTCDEQGAGFAADAYARIRGIGVVCVTYCVGGLKVANTTAEAYAEKSPVVVISGAPGMGERERNPLLHHKVREFDTQANIFRELTAASTVLSQPERAGQEIDRVLHACLRYKRPVYIELPRDIVGQPGQPHHPPADIREASDPKRLRAALADATAKIEAAKRPVILADVEIHRFGLQDDLLALARRTGIPVVTTLLGKSVIGEDHPFFLGVYEGAMGRASVRQAVESSDCLILLGAFLTDINLGIFTARLDPARSIYATSEKLMVGYRSYEEVRFEDFVRGLVEAKLRKRPLRRLPAKTTKAFRPRAGAPLTVKRMFERLNDYVGEDTVVVADVGDALFGASDLFIRKRTEFLSPAYYTSLGFAVPAAIGAQLANPKLRPLVLVGDGAFQMTGMELSTAARFGLNPVVVVLNNRGYGTERPMLDGPFNDLQNWRYSKVPEVLGAGLGLEACTEAEFDEALKTASAHTSSFCLIDAQLDPHDRSPALERLAERLKQKVR